MPLSRHATGPALAVLLITGALAAQYPAAKDPLTAEEPERPQPGATDFQDRRRGIALRVPAGWNFERRDGVLSNFHVDVRSARRQSVVRGVASLNYNPYPFSTFAGVTFYYSVVPHSTVADCAAQVSGIHLRALPDLNVAGVTFNHAQDEHGTICTESRDEVMTALRGISCLRFDLVVNTFCSQTSGAMDLTAKQMGDVNARLRGILQSVTFNSAGKAPRQTTREAAEARR